MSNDTEAQMPADWNDRDGWDRYFRDRLTQDTVWDEWEGVGSIPTKDLPAIATDLKSQGWRSVWVPGCGLSPLPWLLADLGLDVVATDISPNAIGFQLGRLDVSQFKTEWADAGEVGSLAAEVHDFRTDFRQEAFDVIINVKAIQGFLSADIRRIASVHATALRPGRQAYFDTMNVQGERRDELERALEDGGFVVPFAELNRWYRRTLAETGIPHLFILGRPMIPTTGEYADDQERWDRDMALLREVSAEYQTRFLAVREAEEARMGGRSKVATVIYSTG